MFDVGNTKKDTKDAKSCSVCTQNGNFKEILEAVVLKQNQFYLRTLSL